MSQARVDEAAKALVAEGERTRALLAELTEADGARIAWDNWTVKDALGHVGASLGGLLRRMQGVIPPTAVGKTLPELNEMRRQERADWPLARVLEEIETSREQVLEFFASIDDATADRLIHMAAYSAPLWRVAWVSSSHEHQHRRHILRALGRGTTRGEVASLNVSGGGVPKLPIYQAELGLLGLAGDAHRGAMHGGPTAALCLFSLEVINALQREGHPIYPGAIGENVTVSGVDWAAIKPGDRLRIGPTLVEVTRYTTPCTNIRAAFTGEDFSRVLSTKHPGESRCYASVVETGAITVGDPVEHLPA